MTCLCCLPQFDNLIFAHRLLKKDAEVRILDTKDEKKFPYSSLARVPQPAVQPPQKKPKVEAPIAIADDDDDDDDDDDATLVS